MEKHEIQYALGKRLPLADYYGAVDISSEYGVIHLIRKRCQ